MKTLFQWTLFQWCGKCAAVTEHKQQTKTVKVCTACKKKVEVLTSNKLKDPFGLRGRGF